MGLNSSQRPSESRRNGGDPSQNVRIPRLRPLSFRKFHNEMTCACLVLLSTAVLTGSSAQSELWMPLDVEPNALLLKSELRRREVGRR